MLLWVSTISEVVRVQRQLEHAGSVGYGAAW